MDLLDHLAQIADRPAHAMTRDAEELFPGDPTYGGIYLYRCPLCGYTCDSQQTATWHERGGVATPNH